MDRAPSGLPAPPPPPRKSPPPGNGIKLVRPGQLVQSDLSRHRRQAAPRREHQPRSNRPCSLSATTSCTGAKGSSARTSRPAAVRHLVRSRPRHRPRCRSRASARRATGHTCFGRPNLAREQQRLCAAGGGVAEDRGGVGVRRGGGLGEGSRSEDVCTPRLHQWTRRARRVREGGGRRERVPSRRRAATSDSWDWRTRRRPLPAPTGLACERGARRLRECLLTGRRDTSASTAASAASSADTSCCGGK